MAFTRIRCFLFCSLLIFSGAITAFGQGSIAEFQQLLREKAAFDEADFATLKLSQPVVRLNPVSDKSEVAVSGVVKVGANAEDFLKSYRESMTRKSNAAILEMGRFGKQPAPADLQSLTFEQRDIEDLKECVVANCQVKLSASMIERFRNEIDWQSPNYSPVVANLYKQMLLDYVRDYSAHGDAALIEYHDKRNQVSLAKEQRGLAAAPGYVNGVLANPESGLQLVDDAIVWSKFKFGLKPVFAINHVKIYRRDRDVGPQVVIASRQIYANHYFNASRAMTAFVNVRGENPESYLIYENRSIADGLEGPFSGIKREIVQKKTVEGLRTILEKWQGGFEATELAATSAEFSSYQSYGWGRRLFGGVRPLLWLLMISALIALLVLGRRRMENAPGRKTLKPKPFES